ncbi:MAG: SpoIID/LytB domain-containing protein [Fluviicola sp.]
MLRIILLSIFLLGVSLLQAQEVRVGIFHHLNMRGISVSADEGSYEVFGDTTSLGILETVNITWKNNGVGVTTNGIVSVFDTLLIIKQNETASVKLKGTSPSTKQHFYEDNFEITRGPKGLRIVNCVSMNNYLSGVIESEGGGGRHLEYYKVQALMSRTYAIKNAHRHKKDGYQVCDGTHCQAYYNKLRYTPTIRTAVEESEGMVLVDQQNRLVTSYFSANCGGQTCDASYVWNTSVPYLEPFVDTFCIHTRQATWTKSIDKYAWRNYLRDQYGVTEALHGDLIYNFQSSDRTAFYIHPSLGIPMRDLRTKFGLKSAYFSSRLEGSKVVLEGRGFGHGVGLCQEGAMEMAKLGYDYTQIARFYFHNVEVLDWRRNQFFKQEYNSISE